MKNITLGKQSIGNKKVFISEKSINGHIMITGTSGTGKSTLMETLMKQKVEEGAVVFDFNWRNCRLTQNREENLKHQLADITKIIDVMDGIALPLFTSVVLPNGTKEDDIMVAERVEEILSRAGELNSNERKILSEVVNCTIEYKEYENGGLASIANNLLDVNTRSAVSTAQKLSALLKKGRIKEGEDFLNLNPGIYQIDIASFPSKSQDCILRFFLAYFYRMAQMGKYVDNPIVICIDECQNLKFDKDSIMGALLNESRKLGVSLIMAATGFLGKPTKELQVIGQCATNIYFSNERERNRIASLLEEKGCKWRLKLGKLKRGEFIATGNFVLDNEEIDGPICLKTDIPQNIQPKGTTGK